MYALLDKINAWLKTSWGWNLALALAPILAIGLVAACIATPFFIIQPVGCALFYPPPDLRPLSSYPRAQRRTVQGFPVTSPLVLSQTIVFQTDDSPATVLGFYNG